MYTGVNRISNNPGRVFDFVLSRALMFLVYLCRARTVVFISGDTVLSHAFLRFI